MDIINYQKIDNLELESYFEQIREMCIAATSANDYILRFLPHWKSLPTFHAYGAFFNDQLVGVAFLMIQEKYGWLIGLRVHPEWQNNKIAHKLDELRIKKILDQSLPVKGAVLESNSKVLHIFKNLGFTFEGGFSLVSSATNKLKLNFIGLGGSGMRSALSSDKNRIYSFLHSSYSLHLDIHSMYGEDVIWRSINSKSDFEYLIATKKLLILYKNDYIEGIAVINAFTMEGKIKEMEIGRIWGHPQSFLWKISSVYRPEVIRWYTFGIEEEALARQLGFAICRMKVDGELHDERSIVATKMPEV